MIPKILEELQKFVSNANLSSAPPINGEGRIASCLDEEQIVNLIMSDPNWSKICSKPQARMAGDLLITVEGILQPINIKTTNGTTDNATSKTGFVFAYTDMDLDKIPKCLNAKEMFSLIENNKKDIPNKDYWYMSLNKKNMSSVMIRGCKKIKHWVPNPCNGLQINWKKEWEEKNENEISYNESYEKLKINFRSVLKKINESYPDEFQNNLE